MALSAFDNKTSPPTDRTLAAMLGDTSRLWTRLTAHLHAAHGPLVEQWAFSGKAYGWSFRLKETKRVLVYMTPCRGYFLASFVLGKSACEAARVAPLSQSVLALIELAPTHAEGRGVRIPVKNKRAMDDVRRLAAIKFAS